MTIWLFIKSYQRVQCPPRIICRPGNAECQQPRDTTVEAGERALLSVYASGAAPLQYQWFKNEEPMEGETSRNLYIENAGGNDNGARYTCEISNEYGTVTSDPAILTVAGVTSSRTTSIVKNAAKVRPYVAGPRVCADLNAECAWHMQLFTLSGALAGTAKGHGAQASAELPAGQTVIVRLTAGSEVYPGRMVQK